MLIINYCSRNQIRLFKKFEKNQNSKITESYFKKKTYLKMKLYLTTMWIEKEECLLDYIQQCIQYTKM